jgi:predicted HTH transcriptional regulator
MTANNTQSVSTKETFLRFFEDPSRDKLREILKNNLGEDTNIDFKREWPDFDKVSKTLLAFANSNSGLIVVGVEERSDGTTHPTGLDKIIDKATIINGLEKYLPPKLLDQISINDFDYSASEYAALVGRLFQTVSVTTNTLEQPYFSIGSGKAIEESRVYVRRQGKTTEAKSEDIERMIQDRVEALQALPERDLDNDLKELRALYKNLPDYDERYENAPNAFSSQFIQNAFAMMGRRQNPFIPDEGYSEFVARMIEKKKAKITRSI